jgi:NifU-like protein involved in Fe-S cluster formation/bacterioferritin-associated ferredoxin
MENKNNTAQEVKARTHIDVKATVEGKKWFYNETVKEHFFNPKNLLKTEEEAEEYTKNCSGVGTVGSPACGDMMKIWLKINNEEGIERITECKWQTFGCASAIGSTSMLSVMLTENKGMTIEEATAIKPQDIANRLGGLPTRKFHCSVLGDKALQAAINDYYKKTGQHEKIKVEGAKIIDKILKVTDKDIEEAVLEGARTIEDVQKKTKAGVQDKSCIPEIEQLIRFYTEKYFG